jgi:hypothetical protein
MPNNAATHSWFKGCSQTRHPQAQIINARRCARETNQLQRQREQRFRHVQDVTGFSHPDARTIRSVGGGEGFDLPTSSPGSTAASPTSTI